MTGIISLEIEHGPFFAIKLPLKTRRNITEDTTKIVFIIKIVDKKVWNQKKDLENRKHPQEAIQNLRLGLYYRGVLVLLNLDQAFHM